MKKRLTKLMSLGLALAMLFTSVPVSATESVVSTEIVQEESVSSSELLMEVEEESVASELLQEVEAGDAEEIESEEVLEAEEDVVPVELLAPQATENVVPVTPLGDEVTEGNETTNTESEQLPEFLNYKYVLDIDGIDANAEYAIVHKVSGSNRVLHSVATKSDVFNGTVNSNLYTPKVQGTVFTLGSQLWKAIPTDSGEGKYYLQSQLESSQHYYMDLSKESGTLGRVHLTLHNSTASAPVVKITEGSQDGTYKIQAVSGAEQGQFYLGYGGSHFVTANDGIEVYLYKKEIDDQTNIRFMFNDQPDNRWLFLGGEDSVGAFSHVGSGRSYVGHFEEYIRATQNLDSVNVKQRFMINSASKGRDLSETVDNWESLVPVNKPKAISYMISKEDYNKADAGLEEFSADLTSFIDKALKIGFVVIQYPYKTADDATNSNIEKYIQAAETVIASYADETIKASRITKVNHYEKTGSTANWTEQYLTNGFLNQKGHLEIGKQLALETIGSSSNYPNSFASSSLVTTIYERPATYSDKLPQVTASNNSLSVTLSQEIVTAYGANYAYELTTTNEAGASVVIKDKVQVTADTAFVIENLNQGDYWQLQMRTENGQVQLATTEGTVAQGENGADHKPVAFTDRATDAQSELAQKLESEEPMRWLFVGDSITHACKYTYGYDGISQLFDKYVKETLGRPEDVVINTAVWGAFLDDNLGDNAEHRLDYDADVVVIMIGTNDSSVNDRASNYVANMNQLLTKIKAYNPGATIVIRTPLYVWYRTGTPQYQYGNLVTIHNQLKTIAGETAEDGTPKVDFFVDQYSYTALALFEDAWVRNGSVFLGDALHPTQLGQLLLFKELIKELGLEDNDSPMTDLMYDIKQTTKDEKATDIRPYLIGDVTKKSITLNVNQLTATESDLRNIEFTVTNPTTEESRTVKADRQITTDLTAKTASIGWPANTKLEITGLEEDVRYEVQVKGWSISAAKEIVLKTTLALDDEPVPATRTHEEAPQIAGYTLVWPETQTATLDTSKYYLVVAVGENNKAYALYGNQTGVGLTPGNISQADNGKVTAELSNLTTTPTATWLKDGSTALDLAEKLEFCLVEGTGENAGKYAFRTMDGYYLNLEDTLFKTSINYLNVQIAADADTTLKDNRYLHFNLKDEQQVNGQENAHHTIYNGFWAPTGKPNTYNIYLYAKDGATVSGADVRLLRKEVDRIKEVGYEEIDYNANSWGIYATVLAEAEAILNGNQEVMASYDQVSIDRLKDELIEAENGLNRKPVYVEPGIYEYALFTQDDTQIKVGDIFAIYSNNGNARGDNRVLHSPGVEKTDKVQATLQEEGRILPLESNNSIAVEQQLWEVVPMDGNKIALRNVDLRGIRYLDLSKSSTTNIYLSKTPKAIEINSVNTENGTFNILSGDDTGYALNYVSGSFKTAEKTAAGVFRLYKKTKTDTPMEIASSTHEKGTVSGQPMAAGTGGSDNFRIPSLITLSDGTIIGAADARWNHEMDFSAIDIMMVKSKDDGQTWEYSFPIYFNDSTDSRHNRATTFIDPLMVRDKNDKIYLMSDVFPGSTANGYAPYPPERASGYVDIKGAKRMVLYTSPYPEHQNSENFAYYVGEHSTDELKLAPIYEVFGEDDYADTPSFYMDKKFNLYDVNKQPMYCNQLNSSKVVQQNVFYWNSILHVRVAMYLYLITSEDGGNTWSDPMILNPQIRKEDGNDSFYGVGPGAGLWLDNGTEHGMVILPTYSATDFNSQRAQFVYSSDGGVTWKRSENVTKDFWSGENCVVRIDDTTLRHFYRSGTARLQYTDHVWEDGTWKAGDPVTMNDIIRTSNNQISAINYSKTINGENVIIYSTAKHNGGNRVNGTIYVFTVDKDTKALKLQAEYDITPVVQPEGGEAVAEDSFQYSSIAELKDGSIGMLHEYDGAKIIYKKFSMSVIAPNVVFDGDENADKPIETDYENIWVTGVTDKVYDGSKQTQNIKVYDGNKLLRENVDYTISYKNNINANTYTEDELKAFEEEYRKNPSVKSVGNFVAAKEAQVVLKMKGDYSGTRSIFFRIEQQDIENEERFIVDNISAQATKKSQKPVPTVTWLMEDGTVKTLKYKKDFIIPEYEGSSSFIGASENEEGYQLTVQGIENFMGDRPISYKITKGEEVSLSKVTIKAAKSVAYTGQELKPEITVKYKNEPLVLDKDYEVIYTNNKAAGTGTALIRGLEGVHGGTSFIGTKRITFKITGTAMSGAKVTGFDSSYPYTSEAITPVDGEKVKVAIKDKTLILGEDYEVSYEKNVNKGTATVIIKGNPEAGFTGTKKVTFKIGTAALSTAEDSDFTFAFKNAKDVNTYAYTKGGVKPSIELSFKDTVLREGVDYTLSYKNNKALGEATVSIKGKGNFAGTVNESFIIVKKDVTEFTDSVYLEVKDIVEGNSIKQSFKVMDEDGKALSNNKDYNSKAVVYTLVSLPEGTTAELTPGSPITDLNTKLPKGSVVSITVPLVGDFYAGEVTETYRIIEKTYDISKAKIVLLPQEFTGEEITITKDSMFKTRKMSDGTVLTLEGDNANIEVARYQNNIKKGTAKVTFKGKEGTNFGGYKTVTFKINARTVHNAWEGVVENLKKLFSF